MATYRPEGDEWHVACKPMLGMWVTRGRDGAPLLLWGPMSDGTYEAYRPDDMTPGTINGKRWRAWRWVSLCAGRDMLHGRPYDDDLATVFDFIHAGHQAHAGQALRRKPHTPRHRVEVKPQLAVPSMAAPETTDDGPPWPMERAATA